MRGVDRLAVWGANHKPAAVAIAASVGAQALPTILQSFYPSWAMLCPHSPRHDPSRRNTGCCIGRCRAKHLPLRVADRGIVANACAPTTHTHTCALTWRTRTTSLPGLRRMRRGEALPPGRDRSTRHGQCFARLHRRTIQGNATQANANAGQSMPGKAFAVIGGWPRLCGKCLAPMTHAHAMRTGMANTHNVTAVQSMAS